MEKIDEQSINHNHNISINDRKTLLISGVNKVENFDSEEFLIKTTMGTLNIKGNSLELVKLDTILGNISIKGKIDSLEYSSDNKSKDTHGIISRLFK